jgi:predicted phage terminase large subunit-like protein
MAVLQVPVEDQDGNSVWPAKFTPEELDLRKQGLGELRYAQEYLVNPISLFGAVLDLSWLKMYDFDRVQEDGVLDDVEFFYGVDPSISGKGDYCVICVLGKTRDGGLYIYDFVREQAKMERMVELCERTAKIYPPTIMNVEAVAAQQLFVQNLTERTTLPVRSYLPKGKKEDRIAVMAQVYFSTGKVRVRGKRSENMGGLVFDERMSAFVQEWLSFPRGKHDDTLDALESAIMTATSSGMAACLSSEEIEEDAEEKTQRLYYQIQRRRLW